MILYGGAFTGALVGLFSVAYFAVPFFIPLTYSSGSEAVTTTAVVTKPKIIHLKTPEPLKAIYMSSWVAGTPSIRKNLVKLIDDTELNAVVIDIKDYTGRVSFTVSDPELKQIGSSENRIPDITEFIQELHEKNIYVIGRIAVFQDPYMVKLHPDWAVKKKSDGAIWKDYKGISWIDAGARGQWDYTILVGKAAYEAGFDEINLDYIRFPSDGNMKDIYYPYSEGIVHKEVMRNFFEYVTLNLRPTGAKISADLFGMTTTNSDDLNIGQVLEDALPFFDYIAPMVYPSHYPPGFHGFSDPNKYPYEVVNFSMETAVKRAIAASSSPLKLRPWLQDFDYGGIYNAPEVRAQIQATYDTGLTSWMLWDAANKYTPDALLAK